MNEQSIPSCSLARDEKLYHKRVWKVTSITLGEYDYNSNDLPSISIGKGMVRLDFYLTADRMEEICSFTYGELEYVRRLENYFHRCGVKKELWPYTDGSLTFELYDVLDPNPNGQSPYCETTIGDWPYSLWSRISRGRIASYQPCDTPWLQSVGADDVTIEYLEYHGGGYGI